MRFCVIALLEIGHKQSLSEYKISRMGGGGRTNNMVTNLDNKFFSHLVSNFFITKNQNSQRVSSPIKKHSFYITSR